MDNYQTEIHTPDTAQSCVNAGKEIKTGKNTALIFLSFAALVCGGALAYIRSLILFGGYDNRICLYPNGALNTAFNICTAIFGVLLAAFAFIVLRGKEKYTVKQGGVGLIFSQSLTSLSFAALAFSVIFITKKAEASLSTFDSVLVALSLVSAVAFFASAFADKETLGVDAGVLLMLFASACCLFITFYFYFDKTTAIHNTNKKFATLAFSAALLAVFYGSKAFIKKTNKAVFAALNLLCVCYSTMYAVPNLIWYFKTSSPLLLNVFFDVVCLSLGILSFVTLLSFERAEDTQTEDAAEDTAEKINEADTADGELK